MPDTLRLLVLSVLVCKIQPQEIEVNKYLYSQSLPTNYPLYFQIPQNQQITAFSVSRSVPSPTPVPVTLPAQQCLQIPGSIPVPGPVPVSLPAQPCSASPSPVVLPPQPCIPPPTVIISPPISPQPVSQSQPPSVTISSPLPSFQVSSTPISPRQVVISSPPQIPVQELSVSVNVPAFTPQISSSLPSPVSVISTTVVDNSLANKLANVLQLLLVSKTIEANANPSCNSPIVTDVTPLYDAIGNIGTACARIKEEAFGVIPDRFLTVTDFYPVYRNSV